jgi:Tfp pilus assembly protein PilV
MRPSSLPPLLDRRGGFSILEMTVALGILGLALLLVAELGYQVLTERQRDAARQEALEAAVNALEAARACPWEDLTPAWAARQHLSESSNQRLYEGRLEVRVEPEASHPQTRRVTVEVHWLLGDSKPARPVRLVGLRSARSAPATGGKS